MSNNSSLPEHYNWAAALMCLPPVVLGYVAELVGEESSYSDEIRKTLVGSSVGATTVMALMFFQPEERDTLRDYAKAAMQGAFLGAYLGSIGSFAQAIWKGPRRRRGLLAFLS